MDFLLELGPGNISSYRADLTGVLRAKSYRASFRGLESDSATFVIIIVRNTFVEKRRALVLDIRFYS